MTERQFGHFMGRPPPPRPITRQVVPGSHSALESANLFRMPQFLQCHRAQPVGAFDAALCQLDDLLRHKPRYRVVDHAQLQCFADGFQRLRHVADFFRIERSAGEKWSDRHAVLSFPLYKSRRIAGTHAVRTTLTLRVSDETRTHEITPRTGPCSERSSKGIRNAALERKLTWHEIIARHRLLCRRISCSSRRHCRSWPA